MNNQVDNNQHLASIIRTILCGPEEGITCDECFDVVDQYVDMLRAGSDPADVLPHVKAHLDKCGGCKDEFHALISILEAAASPPEPTSATK